MELLLLISAARRGAAGIAGAARRAATWVLPPAYSVPAASARTITAVLPYYGYKRDVGTASSLTALLRSEAERADGGVVSAAHAPPVSAFPVSAADVAKMLTVLGVDRVLSVELQPPGQVGMGTGKARPLRGVSCSRRGRCGLGRVRGRALRPGRQF